MNTFGILAATVAGMALGALWYSPVMFGKAWLAAIGKTEEELGSATAPMIGSVVACLLTAIALDFLLSATGAGSVSGGLAIGAVIGVGVVFPALLSDNLFCGWGTKLLWIQCGYRVTYILVMSAILAAWTTGA